MKKTKTKTPTKTQSGRRKKPENGDIEGGNVPEKE